MITDDEQADVAHESQIFWPDFHIHISGHCWYHVEPTSGTFGTCAKQFPMMHLNCQTTPIALPALALYYLPHYWCLWQQCLFYHFRHHQPLFFYPTLKYIHHHKTLSALKYMSHWITRLCQMSSISCPLMVEHCCWWQWFMTFQIAVWHMIYV